MRFKKLLLLGVGSALAFTMGGVGTAQADTTNSIHKSTAAVALETQLVSVGGGRCAGCHRAHTAKAEKLLKQAQPALCYSCHSGGTGTFLDVVNGVDPNADPLVDGTTNGITNKALRGGGFAYALIDGAAASKTMPQVLDLYSHPASEKVPVLPAAAAPVTSRHQIDGTTTGTMWGNGAISATVNGALDAGKPGVQLECASCHDPHGNGNYRILKPVPNGAATKAVAATAWTPAVLAVNVTPVNIPDAITKVYTTGNYWTVADRNVPTVKGGALPLASVAADATTTPPTVAVVGATDGYITNVSQWCSTCHTRYLAASGSYAAPNRGYVPAVGTTAGSNTAGTGPIDATFTYRHRSDRADKDGINVPNCIQCHVSHGSNVTMNGDAQAVSNPDGTATGGVTGSMAGSSRLLRVDNRGTCEMCHNV